MNDARADANEEELVARADALLPLLPSDQAATEEPALEWRGVLQPLSR